MNRLVKALLMLLLFAATVVNLLIIASGEKGIQLVDRIEWELAVAKQKAVEDRGDA